MLIEILTKYKTSLIFGFIGLFLFILAAAISFRDQPSLTEIYTATDNDHNMIIIDVQGSVNVSGLYEIEIGSRLGDVLKLAGGISSDANTDWIAKNLNQAELLTDGQKIYIPSNTEITNSQIDSASSESLLININVASMSELELLPGIGEKRAQEIIENRPYATVEDLIKKEVISESIFNSIAGKITVY